MYLDTSEESDEGSDYSYSLDSDSDDFYNGYCEKPSKKQTNFISLPKLREEYNEEMDMDKKILLFLYAGEEEDIPFMETLMHGGVPVDCVGQDGWTALMKACLNGKPNVVEFLLSNGSNPNFQAGNYPWFLKVIDLYNSVMACCTLSSASEEKKLACLEHLLQHNADVNAHDKHRSTPLMHAASSGFLSLVRRLLLVDGIHAHARDFDGWNALFHAVSNCRNNVLIALIEHGLDYKSMDSFGRTPISLAEERGFKVLSDLLLSFEDIEVIVEDTRSRPDSYSDYLSELPNEDGEGGFMSDTYDILSLYGCTDVENIPFADFLNMTEKGLYEVGMKIGMHRRYILKNVIHRFHLTPWKKSSIGAITRGVPLGLEEAICIMGSIAKHLTIIKASLRYVQTRIQARRHVISVNFQKETIAALVSCHVSNKLVQERLCSILQQKEFVKPVEIDDLIVKTSESKVRRAFKYGLMILGTTTAGYVIFNFTKRFDCVKQLSFSKPNMLASMRWL